MDAKQNLLIVYTDEVGSTRRDLRKYLDTSICGPRIKLFRRQLEAINKRQDANWKVLKSVGDSLVLSYRGGNATSAVTALFDAWKNLTALKNGKVCKIMRVAIHKPLTRRWADGKLVKRRLFETLGKNGLAVWKSYDSLDDDLFGMEMNLAARLASLPSDAAFVVGENVLDGRKTRQQVVTYLGRFGYALGPSIPVACLKGFNDYIGLNGVCLDGEKEAAELWCTEVLKKNGRNNHRPLLLDSHQFSTWRAVVAKAEIQDRRGRQVQAPHEGDLPEITKVADEALRDLCGAGKELKAFGFHTDMVYEVAESWQGPAASQNRACPPVKIGDRPVQWLDRVPKSTGLVLTHMILSSVFDENVDRLMSKCVSAHPFVKAPYKHNSRQLAVSLRTESMRVFGHPCWIRPKTRSKQAKQLNSITWMIVFQVKGSLPIPPDSPDVFDVVGETDWPDDLYPVGWGLVMGQADGYVLLHRRSSVARPVNDDELVKEIEARCKKGEDAGCFLSQIIPLHVRKLTGPVTPDLPSEVARGCLFKTYGAWEKSMRKPSS